MKNIVLDRNQDVFVSSVSFWEIAIKAKLNKFSFAGLDIKNLPELAAKAGFNLISLEPSESASINDLPRKENHRDPFDRMLIWQAIKRKMVLIGKDSLFPQYEPDGLKIFW